uniref:Uncharacterized protein n=1 Tax=viral metagenome TaxID=1070528 RepID=A0A6C0IGJ1_9ZZZZ
MSEAQFDEVFKKLKEVIADIIKKKEYESITGQKFYDKFKHEFGILGSPAIRTGIKLNKDRIITLFNENIETFKDFCSYHTENADTGARTIINFIVNVINDSEIERQWERYKSKLLSGGKISKIIKNKTKKTTTKGKKWSQKYKDSINCRRPKGFSQKQHCKYGRKK